MTSTNGGTRAVMIDERFWPDQKLNAGAAIRLQQEWAQLVEETPLPAAPRLIAGADVHARGDLARATIVVLRWPELEVAATVHGEAPLSFPYVPGLLSWREIPALLAAFTELPVRPDLVYADGQGLAHPRRFGLACHLGLATGLPTLGCAKSRLVGFHPSLAEERGAQQPLVYHGQEIGAVVRTKDRVKPLYVSIGHRITLDEATHYVLDACTRYRLPETTRLAHRAAQAWARGASE